MTWQHLLFGLVFVPSKIGPTAENNAATIPLSSFFLDLIQGNRDKG